MSFTVVEQCTVRLNRSELAVAHLVPAEPLFARRRVLPPVFLPPQSLRAGVDLAAR